VSRCGPDRVTGPHASKVPYVAVVGPGEATGDELALAEEVGRDLARRRAVLVCGGRGGVMEAASRGAREAGGTVLGILPGPDRTAANDHVDIAVATGMGQLRNGLIVRTADAVIAIGGAYGTLSEIALALNIGRPVIGLGTWQLRRATGPDAGITLATDAAEAVELALSWLATNA
jgi:uncharacterized protein (TIGR00725 family)